MTPRPVHPFGCRCGGGALACDAADAGAGGTQGLRVAAERAAFGGEAGRRRVLRLLGAGTVAAAMDRVFPVLRAQEAWAAGAAAPEKKKLKVGFIAITCATPLITAGPMGFYARHGLEVDLVRTPGWAAIRDRSLSGEYDASHMLSPMPIALTLGVGSSAMPWTVGAIENVNGQAITLAMKHKDRRDPRSWGGFRLAVPFDYSMHNYLLRYYLAQFGLDPDRDVQIRAVPPPEMVATLKSESIDGFLAPDPFNQRAVYDGVGFIHLLTRDIWDGHPCCAFAVPREMVTKAPNTYRALMGAIFDASAFCYEPENRTAILRAISGPGYLDQPEAVVEQVLTGTFPDGLGTIQRDPDRVSFEPFPWQSMALWMMTQMKRWGQVKGDLDWRAVAEQVFLATDARPRMEEAGLLAPHNAYKPHVIMGKTFDPADPEGYLRSFAIRRA